MSLTTSSRSIPMETCRGKVGNDGKCHHACDWGAEAIFDDCAAIIRECQEWIGRLSNQHSAGGAMLGLVVGMKPLLMQWRHASRNHQ